MRGLLHRGATECMPARAAAASCTRLRVRRSAERLVLHAACCLRNHAPGLARALSAAVMSPVTLVKTRMEYGGPKHVAYRNTAHALATIAAQEGPAGLFRGLWPTVLTNAPFSALYYMMYTQLRGVLAGVGRERPGSGGGDCGSLHPTLVNFLSGVCAATAATLLTQPSDVVRTRIQLGLPGTAGGGNALATLGAVARGGPGALLAGAGAWHMFSCAPSICMHLRLTNACACTPQTAAASCRCCAARAQAHVTDGAGVDVVRGTAATPVRLVQPGDGTAGRCT